MEENENENKTADDIYREANKFYEEGEFEKAIELYTEAITREPMYKYYYNRGLSYACQERYEEAQADILKVLELKPNFSEAWYILGLAKEYTHEYDEAIKMYEKAIESEPRFQRRTKPQRTG